MAYLIAYCSVLRARYIETFITRCSSFCSIVPCSFEFILMPKSLVQECYMMFTAVIYQNLEFCYFCCMWCVHLMGMSSTGVLIYAMPSLQRFMPCVFVIYVVTSTSMQTRLRDVADFSPCSVVIFMPCKLDATERSMLILRYFSKGILNIWLCYIHSCPYLKLWSSLACLFRALLLL